ncbi:hypothetical protein M406DRAFT_327520 [Cryphonectria parasitica EP155]|uniref:Clr5 domain-containing protein n=1 Tax=Cryphonectria parasitica (strain ATCC 38755 / EP155) TaxID=660469 RepID=A0A9P5CTF8_CRYP1|nr:uncharacterized protein M406DRAFT_327520 [Cryphonectria parasitica EP155]KAF3769115.1 hypothetical protein M406DRAFT_327520 [Cryphonectria parasitica EP155]
MSTSQDEDTPPPVTALTIRPCSAADKAAAIRERVWAQHMPRIRQLYVDEGRTLKELIEIMKTEHDFVASAKMYKQRLRKWNLRKNIRLHLHEDDPGYAALVDLLGEGSRVQQHRGGGSLSSSSSSSSSSSGAKTGRPVSTEIQLATGQVVDLDRLASHLKRKMFYKRYTSPHGPVTMTNPVRPPDGFYMCEEVLNSTRTYIFGRFRDTLSTVNEIDNTRVVDAPLAKWNKFLFTLRGPLSSPRRFGRVLTLMRQAPEELHDLLASQPASLLSSFFMFMVYLTRCLQCLQDPDEKRQFSRVIRALIRYAAALVPRVPQQQQQQQQEEEEEEEEHGGAAIFTPSSLSLPPSLPSSPSSSSSSSPASSPTAAGTTVPLYGPGHPLPQMLRALARVDDDQLFPLALRAWRLSCQSWDEIVLAASSPREGWPAADLNTQPKGCCATVSDWLNYAAVAPASEIPAATSEIVNSTLRALRQQYSEQRAAAVDEMWRYAEAIENLTSRGELAPKELREFLLHNGMTEVYLGVLEGVEQDKANVMLMRSLEDGRRGLRFMDFLEDIFWEWGDHEKSVAMALWRARMTGDLLGGSAGA